MDSNSGIRERSVLPELVTNPKYFEPVRVQTPPCLWLGLLLISSAGFGMWVNMVYNAWEEY